MASAYLIDFISITNMIYIFQPYKGLQSFNDVLEIFQELF